MSAGLASNDVVVVRIDAPARWVAVLVVAGVLLLPRAGPYPRRGEIRRVDLGEPAAGTSDAPERSPQKAVAGPPKKTVAPAEPERATP